MTSPTLLEIIKFVAQTESTPELAQYWQRRYQEILNQNLFKLSDKTEELALQQDLVDRPATPFGDIILLTHTDKNKNLDQVKIQSTIETSIRLLDGILEIMKFTPEAKNIVSQYRKIGVGILDFEEYMETKDSESEIQQIDYIGNLLSTTCYHASESIAEEKGVCANWSKINKHLRPKSFEYWYNEESGETRSGLELCEDFDQESILESKFIISPRRNSNILLYSPDLEWQIWSDRDETAPKTEISMSPVSPPDIIFEDQPNILTDDNNSLDTFDLTPEPKIIQTQSQIDELKEVFESQSDEEKQIEDDFNQNQSSKSNNQDSKSETVQTPMQNNKIKDEDKQSQGNFFTKFFSHGSDQKQEPLEEEPTPDNMIDEVKDNSTEPNPDNQKGFAPEPETTNQTFETNSTQEENREISDEQKSLEPDEVLPSSGAITETEPEESDQVESGVFEEQPLPIIEPLMNSFETEDDDFQIGELVKVNDVSTEYYDHIYQIIEITEDKKYRLTGADDSLELILWKPQDLEYIDLHELLERINSTPENTLESETTEPSTDEEINQIVEERVNQRVQEMESQTEARIAAEVNQRLSMVQTDHRNIDQEVAMRVQEQMSKIQPSANSVQNQELELAAYKQELEDNFQARVESKVLEELNTPHFQAQIDKLAIEKMNAKAQKIATKKTISTMQMMQKYQEQK